VGFAAVAAVADQVGALEDGKVLGDGGLRDSGVAGEGVDGLLAVAGEFFKEGAAGWVSQGAKDGIGTDGFHGKTITVWL
jgi:hypothetical protein